jgi:hypothetical protein
MAVIYTLCAVFLICALHWEKKDEGYERGARIARACALPYCRRRDAGRDESQLERLQDDQPRKGTERSDLAYRSTFPGVSSPRLRSALI